ncbi:F-box domain [Macleaya cordata]|uniref:F-box domain n=1 Tax=Macleaya cordata TaxID=56857 RepID=A0A200PLZ6_MACCD|nr:F-box domain [Macleaya cordata]
MNRDRNPWNKLDDEMVETVLAQLPTLDIFCCQFVCKRWNSIVHSPTFPIASQQLFDRRPWFIIFNKAPPACVVYDMEVFDWRPRFKLLLPAEIRGKPCRPAVASAGLLCFSSATTCSLIVCNPFTGLVRLLPRMRTRTNTNGSGIAMYVSPGSKNYKVFVAFGKWPKMRMKVFSSGKKKASWMELSMRLLKDEYGEWSLWDKGVTVMGNEGKVLVYYLTLNGILVCFDTQKGTIFLCPRLLEREHIFTMDLVECGGRVFIVVLMEAIESSFSTTRTLHVWEFDNKKAEWEHIAAMPPNMSQDYYDVGTLITCSGQGNYIMVCVNSIIDDTYFNHVVIYNIKKNTWVELSTCFDNFDGDDHIKVLCPYAFKPEMEAKV